MAKRQTSLVNFFSKRARSEGEFVDIFDTKVFLSKIPYLFSYKVQHFFYENFLVHSKSALNPSVFKQQNLTKPVKALKRLLLTFM